MFIGIVVVVGCIELIVLFGMLVDVGVCLIVQVGGLDLVDVVFGDSIVIQGVCMMVIEKIDIMFDVDVLCESLNWMVGFVQFGEVNFEKVLCVYDCFGGYIVLGYVDGFGIVLCFVLVGELYEL